MEGGGGPVGTLALLEADLRALSAEARRGDGFAGWLTGPQHPELKEAAEHAIIKLRSLPPGAEPGPAVAGCEEVLRPFLLACESRSVPLALLGLGCVQKLLANDGVAAEHLPAVIAVLQHFPEVFDEGVQLKTLQTVLTILQSRLFPAEESVLAMLLGLCFRMQGSTRSSDSVHTIAAATLRQAVALLFDRVVASMMETGASAEAPSAIVQTALLLFDDLCHLAGGKSAAWLQVQPLPKVIALDMLEFVLSQYAVVFKSLPPFERLIGGRLCSLLMTSLRGSTEYEPGAADLNEVAEKRLLLRTVGSVVRNFAPNTITECEIFLVFLIKSLDDDSAPAWNRSFTLEVMRSICADPDLLRFLFETYDSRVNASSVFHDLVLALARLAQAGAQPLADPSAPDLLATIALIFSGKAKGLEFSPDPDDALAHVAYTVSLALEGLLNVVSSLSKLADRAVGTEPSPGPGREDGAEADGAASAAAAMGDLNLEGVLAAMVASVWELLLSPLSLTLSRSSGEALMLELLKGYQSFTQTCGVLGAGDARDAFLASLCQFTLQSPRGLPPPPSSATGAVPDTGGNPTSPSSVASPMRGGGRVGGFGPAQGEPQVLTPKNVQALRTLFNIAHRLANTLGNSWFLVLETLANLERVLDSPHTTTQEGISSAVGANTSDLSVLSVAAAQLFSSSPQLSDAAIDAMFGALKEVSSKELAEAEQASALSASRKMLFMLGRMVDTVLANRHRIDKLWGIMDKHLLVTLNSAAPHAREEGMQALARLDISLLGEPVPEAAERVAAAAGEAAFEALVVSALKRLAFDRALAADVRLGSLRLLQVILQKHGESLTSGWSAVLGLLMDLEDLEGLEGAVALAFQIAQLIMQDYIANIPDSQLPLAVRMASAYAANSADLNISLTAVGLLWNMADAFGNRFAAMGDHPTAEAQVVMQELLMPLFEALSQLAVDRRPEVRNSGLRTLVSTLVSHGHKLAPDVWKRCVFDILFPLLQQIRDLASGQSKEESVGTEVSNSKGRQVVMLVHHSRNSLQKQWDETVVLSLNGVMRLLRAHMAILSPLEGFDQLWDQLVSFIEESILGGSREVGVAAIASLMNVLQAHVGTPAMPRPLWKRALRGYLSAARGCAVPGTTVPVKARSELVLSLGKLYSARRQAFDEADVKLILGLLDALVRSPTGEAAPRAGGGAGGGYPFVSTSLPPVQSAVLDTMAALPPLDERHINAGMWPVLLGLLLSYASEAVRGPSDAPPDGLALLRQQTGVFEQSPDALTPPLAERAIQVFLGMYKEDVPADVRAEVFHTAVGALSTCMGARKNDPAGSLWRVASRALVETVRVGLPAVNVSRQTGGSASRNIEHVWVALASVYEDFLLGKVASGEVLAEAMSAQPDAFLGDGELEESVLDSMSNDVLTACAAAPEAVRERLVSIVDRGVSRPVVPGATTRFAHVCLRKLYVLVGRGGEPEGPHACTMSIARKAYPLLLRTCTDILTRFASHEAELQEASRQHTEDVLCAMEVLEALTQVASVTDALSGSGYALPSYNFEGNIGVAALMHWLRGAHGAGAGGAGRRERSHLFLLYEPLVRCAACREPRVREKAAVLLSLAGQELGLCRVDTTE